MRPPSVRKMPVRDLVPSVNNRAFNVSVRLNGLIKICLRVVGYDVRAIGCAIESGTADDRVPKWCNHISKCALAIANSRGRWYIAYNECRMMSIAWKNHF